MIKKGKHLALWRSLASSFKARWQRRRFRFIFSCAVVLVAATGLWYVRYYTSMPQAAIYFLNDVALPDPAQRVLVFAPHPDDETIGAGGYIAAARRKGAEVKIVLVTDGNKHHLESQRYNEFKKATSLLGVPESDLEFWNYPDGKLSETNQTELGNKVKAEIEGFSPSIVIFPCEGDLHPDHATTGRIVSEDLTHEASIVHAYQYLVHYRRFPQPKKFDPSLYLLPPVNLVQFDNEWQRLNLSTEEEDAKTEAIYTYRTQLRVPFLRSLILSSVRQNELFSVSWRKNDQ